MPETYFYCTMMGEATVHKGDGQPLGKLGKFKTEKEALAACKAHFAKVCKACDNFGRERPEARFM